MEIVGDFRRKVQNLSENHLNQYDKYLESLLVIYHKLNLEKKVFSDYILDDLIVIGGSLYFFIEREARYLGLDLKSSSIYEKFLQNPTTDIDIQGHIENENYQNITESSFPVIQISYNFEDIIKRFYLKKPKLFDDIAKIFSLSPFNSMNNTVQSKMFATDTKFRNENSIIEIKPQLNVKSKKDIDHILEILFYINFDKPFVKRYELSCLGKYGVFYGEDICVSITQQIYPNERTWKLVDFSTTTANIFQNMKILLENDEIAMIKFNQGFYRTHTIFNILKLLQERGEYNNLISIITTNYDILQKKLFYFNSKQMRKLCQPDMIKRGMDLRKEFVNNGKQIASIEDTLKFLELFIDLWLYFSKEIFKRYF